MKAPAWKLGPDDHVLAAWADPAAGPGWSNRPVWVVVRDGDGRLREECLQPDEQSAEIMMLYRYSAMASADMRAAVVRRMMARKTRARSR